jgi:hypothetical protein
MTRNPNFTALSFTCFRLVALSAGETPWAPVRLARPTRKLFTLATR